MRDPDHNVLPFLLIVISTVTIGATAAVPALDLQPLHDHPLDLSKCELRLVYENDFREAQKIAREEDFIEQLPRGEWRRTGRPPQDAEWIAEGWGGCMIRDGKLWVAPSEFAVTGQPKPVDVGKRSHMVVWNRRVFPPDFLLAFDVNHCGSTNGLTIVFFCATGKNGEGIFDVSLPPRRGDYATYHSGALANYSDAYWSRNTTEESASNRLRKNPGFQPLAAGESRTTGPTDVTHHIRILKVGGRIEIEVDGNVVLQYDDTQNPLGAGRIGLRSMAGVTRVAYGGFKVWQVEKRR